MSQVQTTIELTTYEKKVKCSEIPSFVTLLQDDSLDLLEKTNRVLSDEFSSFAMRAWALLVREYLTYEKTPEDKARVDKATRIIGKLEKLDFDKMLAARIIKNPVGALEIIKNHGTIIARVQDRMSLERELIKNLTNGAQRQAQIGFDRGLKYGELRDSPSQSSGNKQESISAGVYKITLGKAHLYRFVFDSATNWTLYAVAGEKVAYCASYEDVKEKSDQDDFDPRCSSATRARKIAKVCKVGYRGYASIDALAVAFLAKFENMSAGNPSERNWELVDTQPLAWLALVSENGGKLPKEQII